MSPRSWKNLVLVPSIALGATGLVRPVQSASAVAPDVDASLAAAPQAAAPQADAAIVRELVAIKDCDDKDLLYDCAPADAWKKRIESVEATDEDSEAGKAERRAYVTSCVSAMSHASPGVREAAAACTKAFAESAHDPKGAAERLVKQYPVDTSRDARFAELGALGRFDPVKLGLAPDVISLARPLVGRRTMGNGNDRELTELVWTLRPSDSDVAVPPEVTSFAIELIDERRAVRPAVAILERQKSLTPEACKALLALAETKRGSWADAVEVLASVPGCTPADRERSIQIVLEVATRPSGPSTRFGLGETVAIAHFVESGEASAEQKVTLRKALEAAERVEGRKRLARLRDALDDK